MDTSASAVLQSWTLNWSAVTVLLTALLLYVRGWLKGRELLHEETDQARLTSFCLGLLMIFLAVASPLDAFDTLFLSVHMVQHLLLMMLAPPLLLYGRPLVPMLRGLPKPVVKEALGPFLAWPALRKTAGFFSLPPVGWLLFALSTLIWHMPYFYEQAVRSSAWHSAQHACFFWSGIAFWWPILEPRPKWPRWAFIPYLLLGDLVNSGISAFFVFSNKVLYPSYGLVRANSLKVMDDQVLAGVIMWVPGSLVYLIPAFALAIQTLQSRLMRPQAQFVRIREKKPRREILPLVARHRKWLQAAVLLVAAAVMWDGWFGKQVTPLNLAGTVPWVYWRGLTMLALLAVGNLFCMACPFVLVRDAGRRLLPARWRWPKRLRTKWLAALLFVLYLWAYEALAIWDHPWMTAWLVAGYFITTLVIDGLFRGASFCKYICPIGQFHFVTSLLSPHEISIKKQETCRSCRTFDCIKGNARTRGCELDLFQPKKVSNLDCTFCLDCVKACPHDNVALVPVTPAKSLLVNTYRSSIGRLTKRLDWIAMILVVTFGAFANAGGMADPVMMWEHRWHARMGMHAMPWIVGGVIFSASVFAPLILMGLGGLLSVGVKAMTAIRHFAITLAPVGVGMWAAHVAYHAIAPYVADVTPLEILLLDLGVLVSMYLIWKTAQGLVTSTGRAVALMLPWGVIALGMYAAGLWILFQPMQMRGMSM